MGSGQVTGDIDCDSNRDAPDHPHLKRTVHRPKKRGHRNRPNTEEAHHERPDELPRHQLDSFHFFLLVFS